MGFDLKNPDTVDTPENDMWVKPITGVDLSNVTNLELLNLKDELLLAYKRMRAVADSIDQAGGDPKERINVQKACTTLLSNITNVQERVYNTDRLRRLEEVLIEVLKEFPQVQEPFLKRYAEALETSEKST